MQEFTFGVRLESEALAESLYVIVGELESVCLKFAIRSTHNSVATIIDRRVQPSSEFMTSASHSLRSVRTTEIPQIGRLLPQGSLAEAHL